MFSYTLEDVSTLLRKYGMNASLLKVEELQKYDDDDEDGQLRVIVKVTLDGFPPLVVKIKDDRDVSETVFESQCRFSETLAESGIPTARILPVAGENQFVLRTQIDGRAVFVTAEAFMENEVRFVDVETAEKMGALLARSHNVSEERECHVPNRVLFDPFEDNALFSALEFLSLSDRLAGENLFLHRQIAEEYRRIMAELEPLRLRPRYAVQGDISTCNCFFMSDGGIGFFDFNNAGDCVLFCDAVMQGFFVARQMEYPLDRSFSGEDLVNAFFRGYCSVRPFNEEDKRFYPLLRAVIDAFWADDIGWSSDNGWSPCKPEALFAAVERGDSQAVRQKLEEIQRKLTKHK
ncbi:MAG: hypothetical protein IKR53_05680 [Clostridia bacterium]|nr:hypothetical protein [Clostridia bacterium]